MQPITYLAQLWCDVTKLTNNQLLLTSLTHKSFSADFDKHIDFNERMEFLGDSVVWLIVNTELFNRFPDYQESSLTQYKIALVREENLATVARNIWLDMMIRIWKGEERRWWRNNNTILCDCCEALIWYIYLDGWRDVVYKFVVDHVMPTLDTVSQIKSYKSLLQELTQLRFKNLPIYEESELERDDTKNYVLYQSNIKINENIIWTWIWWNKKKAQEAAAQAAYEHMQNDW